MQSSRKVESSSVLAHSALKVEYHRRSTLRSDFQNPRLHTPKQVRQIARSIESFGFNVPLLIDSQMLIVAGHGRLAAAELLNIEEVPTICLDHLSPAQRRAFAIADNRLTENASWDPDLLGAQLKALAEADLDFSMEATGFEMGEIDFFIEGFSESTKGNDDPVEAVPEDSGPAVSKVGDLWRLGEHRILCGDSLAASSYTSLMGANRAALVFADPPYNVPIDGHATGLGRRKHREFSMAVGEMSAVEFQAFLRTSLTHAAEHSLDGTLSFVCMDWRHLDDLIQAGKQVYDELKNICVWVKDNAGMGSLYRSQHELILVFKKGAATHQNNIQLGKFGRSRSNVWNHPGANSLSRSSSEKDLLALHPTIKPVSLVADAIMDCSSRGDVILDPFLGSGTTLLAAVRTGRICFGLEIDPLYVDTAVRRWQRHTKDTAIHSASGKIFSQLEMETTNEKR